MKVNKKFLFATLIVMGFIFCREAYAEQMNGNDQNTPIQIQLVENPLQLTNVKAPTFGSYTINNHSQTIQATGDLVIGIQDNRDENSSPWGLDYEISFFENEDSKKTIGEVLKFKVGPGTLSSNSQSVNTNNYKAQEIVIGQGVRGRLMQTTLSPANNYEYKVSKDKISITLPNNCSVGTYRAIQKVTLVSLPIVD